MYFLVTHVPCPSWYIDIDYHEQLYIILCTQQDKHYLALQHKYARLSVSKLRMVKYFRISKGEMLLNSFSFKRILQGK